MNLHLHDMRKGFAWLAGGAFLLGPMAFAFDRGPEADAGLSRVSGRITLDGRPVHDAILCFDTEGGEHEGFCAVLPDGTFQLINGRLGDGVSPGVYRVHLFALSSDFDVPEKYQRCETSGVEVRVAPDWSTLDLDLR